MHRSWEFTSDTPVRSMVLLYAIYGPPLYVLKFVSQFGFLKEASYLQSYLLLVLPRLVVMLLSIGMDVMLFNLARRLHLNTNTVMLVYTTSYVSLVYYTRTLSNTVEAFFFVALLCVTMTVTPVTCSHSSKKDKLNLSRRSIHDSGDIIETETCKSDVGGSPFVVALILVAGFFNRPTFIFYAVVPYLNWLMRGSWEVIKHDVLLKFLLTLLNAVAIATAFLIGDSMYYGTLTRVTLSAFKIDSLSESLVTVMRTLVVTPLNFIQYNMESSNLAAHGIHPRITHLLVNMPLLFGVLALIPAMSVACVAFRQFGCSKCENLSGKRACKALILSIAVPLLMLSLFAHQEARFLIPVLTPLSLLYSHLIFGSAAFKAVTVTWVLFNVAGCELFGALHQGGLLPCLGNVHTREPQVTRHVIFYHTYMPPRFLLALPSQHALGESGNSDSPRCGSTTVYDLKGASAETLNKKVKEIAARNTCLSNEILLASPATLDYQLCSSSTTYKSQLLQQFHLHLSTEDLPNVEDFWCGSNPPRQCSFPLNCNNTSLVHRLYSLMSLNLYQLSMP